MGWAIYKGTFVSNQSLFEPYFYINGKPIYTIASPYGLETFIVKLNVAYDAGIPDRHVNMSPLYIYYRNIMLLELFVLTLWLCNITKVTIYLK